MKHSGILFDKEMTKGAILCGEAGKKTADVVTVEDEIVLVRLTPTALADDVQTRELFNSLSDLLQRYPFSRIILNVEKVEKMTSQFMWQVSKLDRMLREMCGRLVLSSLSPDALRSLTGMQTDEMPDICSTEEEAIESFRARACLTVSSGKFQGAEFALDAAGGYGISLTRRGPRVQLGVSRSSLCALQFTGKLVAIRDHLRSGKTLVNSRRVEDMIVYDGDVISLRREVDLVLEFRPSICTPMAHVPAGEFTMGKNQGRQNEKQGHRVSTGAFYIEKHPVTNASYKRFVDAAGHRFPSYWRKARYPTGTGPHPVTGVTWEDAAAYAEWCGRRLPSEVEWEKAARGESGWTYPWGNRFSPALCNSLEHLVAQRTQATGASPAEWAKRWLNSKEGKALMARGGPTTPVGRFPGGASPYGCHDLLGNVWEWTNDLYVPRPGGTGRTESPESRCRIIRGGSALSPCGTPGCSIRRALEPGRTDPQVGFRCAMDAPAPDDGTLKRPITPVRHGDDK